jgi:cysteine desulfurase
MNIDLLSVSAHKLYGPKGIGALFVRRKPTAVSLKPYMVGGGQERGLRGGTHNVPAIVGLGVACEIALSKMREESTRLSRLRDRIIEVARAIGENVTLNGHPSNRLPNNVNLTFRGIDPDTLTRALNDVAYSSASACMAGAASHVQQAIGADTSAPDTTTVRFGLGRFTTENEVELLIARLRSIAANARRVSGT